MKKNEIKEIKDEIEKLINSLPKKEVIPFIDMLKTTYSKEYDEPIYSERLIEIAKEIKKISPTTTCIPVGYYEWYHSTIYFYTDRAISDNFLDKYHIQKQYMDYIAPLFEKDMEENDWKKVCKLWDDFIEESMLQDGKNSDSDDTDFGYAWIKIYDIDKNKFIDFDEL